ncbi:MAG: class I SAM-dependent methyltransferase [Micromonosporaceae bacterium]
MSVTAVFGAVAGTYAAARPGYPPEVYSSIERLSARRLEGAVVADVGAGTGISARQMRDRGAHVVAVEPSGGMLAELVAASPGVRVVRGDGNALPLRDKCADFVTYAQAWHWADPDRAVSEFLRVLRPGGAFAAWWNLTVRSEPWAKEQEQRLIAACPRYRDRRDRYPQLSRHDAALVPAGRAVQTAEVPWSRRLPVDVHLANLSSKSYVARLGADAAAAFLAAERAVLLARFPNGMVTEEYQTILLVVTA